MESEERETVEWIGAEEEPIELDAKKILDVIAEGNSIKVMYAVIKGNLNIRKIEGRLEKDEDGKSIIPGDIAILLSEIKADVDFSNVTFSGIAEFWDTKFSGDADFSKANFSKNASFWYATFSEYADFRNAIFSKYTNFSDTTFSLADFGDATFSGDADFWNTKMKHSANFAEVNYKKNTVFVGLWNNILQPLLFHIIWILTIGKVSLAKKKVTKFSRFNTEAIMDGSSNPYLKRYIDDEQWIQAWRGRGRWRNFLFIVWELTSHCGHSLSLWGFWSLTIATVFAFIYRWLGNENITFSVDKLSKVPADIWDYLYYSIVTFTTLGFGDIFPLTKLARIAVGIEVVLGYIMFAGLISIFANKFARRS